VVTETPDRDSDRALWDWLNSRPEVLSVALAFAHFDDGEAVHSVPLRPSTAQLS